MESILNCNLIKLREIASSVWKDRYDSIRKISYFRGIEEKPHTLFFDIDPGWKPKEDFAYEILNSFSHIYVRQGGGRKPRGTRSEIIETCINPDPEHPDLYLEDWQFYVKLEDEYYEKKFISGLSAKFIYIEFPSELERDYSKGDPTIKVWGRDYFNRQVSGNSEVVLYHIKTIDPQPKKKNNSIQYRPLQTESIQNANAALIQKYTKIVIQYCGDYKKRGEQAPSREETQNFLENLLNKSGEVLGKKTSLPERIFRKIWRDVPTELKRDSGVTTQNRK